MSVFSTNVAIDGTVRLNMLSLGDFAAGGSIGSAATTVDVNAIISIAQTTNNQVLTIPNPTDTTAGRILFIHNDGTARFAIQDAANNAGSRAMVRTVDNQGIILQWDGAAWSLHGFARPTLIQLIRVDSGSGNVTTTSASFSTLKSSGTTLFSGRPVTFFMSMSMTDQNGGVNELYRAELAIQIDAGADNVISENVGDFHDNHQGSAGQIILTPSAGTHTINLRWRRVVGAGTMQFDLNDWAYVFSMEM